MGYKLTWVYIRPNGTEQRIRPTRWMPWANTLAYWKFDGDLNSWVVWGATLSWTPYWFTTWLLWQALESGNYVLLLSSLTEGSIFSWAFAIAFCAKMLSSNTLQRLFAPTASTSIDIQYEFYNDFSWFQVYNNDGNIRIAFPLANPWVWVWKKFVLTWDGVNQIELYIDGTKVTPYNNYNTTFAYPNNSDYFNINWNDGTDMAIDELIIENKYWTQSDVDDYLALFS